MLIARNNAEKKVHVCNKKSPKTHVCKNSLVCNRWLEYFLLWGNNLVLSFADLWKRQCFGKALPKEALRVKITICSLKYINGMFYTYLSIILKGTILNEMPWTYFSGKTISDFKTEYDCAPLVLRKQTCGTYLFLRKQCNCRQTIESTHLISCNLNIVVNFLHRPVAHFQLMTTNRETKTGKIDDATTWYIIVNIVWKVSIPCVSMSE